MGQVFLDICHIGEFEISFKFIGIIDLKNTSPLSRCPGQFCDKRESEILHDVSMMKMIIDSGPGMRYAEQMKKGRLLDLLVSVKVRLQTGKNLLAHGCEKLSIIQSRVENNSGAIYQLSFLGGIIIKVGFYPKGEYLWDPF